MATSLPSRPDLQRFRRDARRLQRAVRAGDPTALDLVSAQHPEGPPADPSTFALSAAQLVIARRYGFPSWPKLVGYLEIARGWTRDPAALTERQLAPADLFCALACLTYSELDEPARWRRASAMLAATPELPSSSLAAAAVVGDPAAVARHLTAHRADELVGPYRWTPLLYLTYSRLDQVDPVGTLRVLMDAGADPNSGYLWQGLPTPFTALTGCFGEGEQGPGRQPRHLQGDRLARLLLDRGADPNDGQALYNRMFGRDNGHLRLLFQYGLGTGVDGIWRRRLGSAVDTPAELLQRQVDWAAGHGFTERLHLLAEHGYPPSSATTVDADLAIDITEPNLDIHRAGSPDAVRAAAAAGADVNARWDGRTALHHQAWIGDVDMVRALLDVGARADILDETYRTRAVDWARHGHQPHTAALLEELEEPNQ